MKTTSMRARLALGAFSAAIAGGLLTVQAADKQITDLEEDIAALKVKLEELGGPGGSTTLLLSNIETAKKEIEEAKVNLPEKEKTLAANSYLLGAYQSAFRVVTTMVAGENLGTIRLNDGEVIPGASFLKMERDRIFVQTGTTSRSLPLAQLPATLNAKFKLPPTLPAPHSTFENLIASKPAALRTKADLAASSGKAPKGEAENGGVEKGAEAAPSPSDVYLEVQQRNGVRQKQILALKEQYAALFQAKKIVRTEQAVAEERFRSAKIKKARSEVESTMGVFTKQIQKIEEDESRIRNDIIRIQGEFE